MMKRVIWKGVLIPSLIALLTTPFIGNCKALIDSNPLALFIFRFGFEPFCYKGAKYTYCFKPINKTKILGQLLSGKISFTKVSSNHSTSKGRKLKPLYHNVIKFEIQVILQRTERPNDNYQSSLEQNLQVKMGDKCQLRAQESQFAESSISQFSINQMQINTGARAWAFLLLFLFNVHVNWRNWRDWKRKNQRSLLHKITQKMVTFDFSKKELVITFGIFS